MIPASTAVKANLACPVCRCDERFGYGDCARAIGVDAALAARILGVEAAPNLLPAEAALAPRSLVPKPHFLNRVCDAVKWIWKG